MPIAKQYIPPTSKDFEQLLLKVDHERANFSQVYEKALRYYKGVMTEQLEVEDEQPNDNRTRNLVKIAAERTASFLFPSFPKVKIDLKQVEQTPEELFAEQVLKDNGGIFFLTKWAIQGWLAGNTYIRVFLNDYNTVEFELLDPRTVTVYYYGKRVTWYQIKTTEEIRDYVNFTTFWMEYVYDANSKKLLESNRYPHAICPIIETPHLPDPDSRFGQSELQDTTPQDQINLLLSNISQINRQYTKPRDVITGATVDSVQKGKNIYVVPSPAARITRLEMKSDLGGIQSQLDQAVSHFLSTVRVVLLKGEAKDLQRVTNASVQALFLDMLSKNSILMDTYTASLEKMLILAMQMSPEITSSPLIKRLYIKLGNPLPTDKMELATINQILVTLGERSLQTAADSMGDNWAFEQEAIASEFEQNMEKQKLTLDMEKKYATMNGTESSDTNNAGGVNAK